MKRAKKTFISAKYHSMLRSGTVIAVLTSATFVSAPLIAGIMLGKNAVIGVTLVTPVYSLATFFAMVISLGIPILYTREAGAFRKKEAGQVFGTGIVMTAFCGVLLFLLLAAWGNDYLYLTGPSDAVFNYGSDYLYWMKYAVMLSPFESLLSSIVFADGDEKVSTGANLASGAGNVILSVIFCRSMGTLGLGLALFLSLMSSVIICLVHFLKRSNTLHFCLYFSWPVLKDVLRYSIVDSVAYLFIAVSTAVMNHFVSSFFGPGLLIIVSAVTIIKECTLVFDGIGEAITPIISLYLGEETYPGVREVWRLAKRTAVIESLAVSIILIIFAPQISGFLGIKDPVLERQIAGGIRLLAATLFFSCRIFLDSSYFILIDRVPLGVLVCALRDIVFSLPLAMAGAVLFGVTGLFAGLAAAPALAYAASVLYIRLRHGKGCYPLFLSERESLKKVRLFEFTVDPDRIIKTKDMIGDAMKENLCPGILINRTQLLFEEVFMTIYDHNTGKTVLAECSLEMGEHIRLITKDDGILLDLSDPDRQVESIRGYVLSNLVNCFTIKRMHFLALSYNRNAFKIT